MKFKHLVLVLILCLVLIMVSACKDDNNISATPTEKPESTPTATPMQTNTPVPTPTVEPTPIVTIEPGTGKYAEGIKEEVPLKAYLDKEDPALIEGLHIDPSSSASIQFFPTTTFNKLHIRLCTWTQTSGHSIEILLYRWQGSYDTTLQSEPVFTNTYTDYPDNVWLEVDLGKEYEDGEYLVDVVNISEANHVGIWISKEEHVMQRFYKDAEVYESGIAQFAIGYTKTPNKIYGPLSDPGF